jgi:hypothetical protein
LYGIVHARLKWRRGCNDVAWQQNCENLPTAVGKLEIAVGPAFQNNANIFADIVAPKYRLPGASKFRNEA